MTIIAPSTSTTSYQALPALASKRLTMMRSDLRLNQPRGKAMTWKLCGWKSSGRRANSLNDSSSLVTKWQRLCTVMLGRSASGVTTFAWTISALLTRLGPQCSRVQTYLPLLRSKHWFADSLPDATSSRDHLGSWCLTSWSTRMTYTT